MKSDLKLGLDPVAPAVRILLGSATGRILALGDGIALVAPSSVTRALRPVKRAIVRVAMLLERSAQPIRRRSTFIARKSEKR